MVDHMIRDSALAAARLLRASMAAGFLLSACAPSHAAYIGPPNTTPLAQLVKIPTMTLLCNASGVSASVATCALGATLAYYGSVLQTVAGTGDCTWPANSFVTVCPKLNGVAYPTAPTVNTVPVVTAANTVTYEKVPNAAIQNPSVTIAGHAVALGASQAIAAADLSNGVTGSGAVVLGTSPTLASPTLTGTVAGPNTIPNGVLVNSSVTIAGHSVALGASQTLSYSDLSAGAPTATASTLGLVKPDGTTLTNAAGAISVAYGAIAGTSAQGNDSRIVGALQATAGQIPGVASATAASAGNIGEYVVSSVVGGSAVPITTGVVTNVTSISLTAGDWDVQGACGFTAATTTAVTLTTCGTNVTSATLGGLTTGTAFTPFAYTGNGTANLVFPTGVNRLSLASTTTVFLVAQSNFATSTMSAYGYIRARRMH